MADKDDAESFMSLEDDSPKPSRKKGSNKAKSSVKPSQSSNQEVIDAEILIQPLLSRLVASIRLNGP